MRNDGLSKRIYEEAIECGFDNCGIVPRSNLAGFRERLEERYASVPQSRYFYGNMESLRGTKDQFPWAKSVIILDFDFGKYRFPEAMRGRYGKAFFLYPEPISKFGFDTPRFEAWLANQNIRTEGGNTIAVGPLRYLAVEAGMGGLRRNNFFYTETGSWHTLIGYAIDAECELIHDVKIKPCPEKCNLCQRACTTHALQTPYTLNPFNCVSFLTTFGNCGVPEGLEPAMFKDWVIGCDMCQDVCPFNRRHDWDEGEPWPGLEELAPNIEPANYDRLSDEFLISEVIPRTDGHLQPKDVEALRINARRALNYERASISESQASSSSSGVTSS